MANQLSTKDLECILCGARVDACPYGMLSLAFGIPRTPKAEEDDVPVEAP